MALALTRARGALALLAAALTGCDAGGPEPVPSVRAARARARRSTAHGARDGSRARARTRRRAAPRVDPPRGADESVRTR